MGHSSSIRGPDSSSSVELKSANVSRRFIETAEAIEAVKMVVNRLRPTELQLVNKLYDIMVGSNVSSSSDFDVSIVGKYFSGFLSLTKEEAIATIKDYEKLLLRLGNSFDYQSFVYAIALLYKGSYVERILAVFVYYTDELLTSHTSNGGLINTPEFLQKANYPNSCKRGISMSKFKDICVVFGYRIEEKVANIESYEVVTVILHKNNKSWIVVCMKSMDSINGKENDIWRMWEKHFLADFGGNRLKNSKILPGIFSFSWNFKAFLYFCTGTFIPLDGIAQYPLIGDGIPDILPSTHTQSLFSQEDIMKWCSALNVLPDHFDERSLVMQSFNDNECSEAEASWYRLQVLSYKKIPPVASVNRKFHVGDVVYVMGSSWLVRWCKYAGVHPVLDGSGCVLIGLKAVKDGTHHCELDDRPATLSNFELLAVNGVTSAFEIGPDEIMPLRDDLLTMTYEVTEKNGFNWPKHGYVAVPKEFWGILVRLYCPGALEIPQDRLFSSGKPQNIAYFPRKIAHISKDATPSIELELFPLILTVYWSNAKGHVSTSSGYQMQFLGAAANSAQTDLNDVVVSTVKSQFGIVMRNPPDSSGECHILDVNIWVLVRVNPTLGITLKALLCGFEESVLPVEFIPYSLKDLVSKASGRLVHSERAAWLKIPDEWRGKAASVDNQAPLKSKVSLHSLGIESGGVIMFESRYSKSLTVGTYDDGCVSVNPEVISSNALTTKKIWWPSDRLMALYYSKNHASVWTSGSNPSSSNDIEGLDSPGYFDYIQPGRIIDVKDARGLWRSGEVVSVILLSRPVTAQTTPVTFQRYAWGKRYRVKVKFLGMTNEMMSALSVRGAVVVGEDPNALTLCCNNVGTNLDKFYSGCIEFPDKFLNFINAQAGFARHDASYERQTTMETVSEAYCYGFYDLTSEKMAPAGWYTDKKSVQMLYLTCLLAQKTVSGGDAIQRSGSDMTSVGLHIADSSVLYLGPAEALSRIQQRARAYSSELVTRSLAWRGVCGLINLGNTCYMASGLQCLTHSPLLSDYFLKKEYKKDLNISNVLGTGGFLLEEYAVLMNAIYNPQNAWLKPVGFKKTLAKFRSQFVGADQQDVQEFLGVVLDSLHEDSNRIVKKPYLTAPSDDSLKKLSLFQQSIESWCRHTARNNSIFVDVCQGQLRSTVRCPECGKVSHTFDPFMFLSLPVPVLPNAPGTPLQLTKAQSVRVWVTVNHRMRRHGKSFKFTKLPGMTALCVSSTPHFSRYIIEVSPLSCTIGSVKAEIGKLLGVAGAHLLALEVRQSSVIRLYDDQEYLSSIALRGRNSGTVGDYVNLGEMAAPEEAGFSHKGVSGIPHLHYNVDSAYKEDYWSFVEVGSESKMDESTIRERTGTWRNLRNTGRIVGSTPNFPGVWGYCDGIHGMCLLLQECMADLPFVGSLNSEVFQDETASKYKDRKSTVPPNPVYGEGHDYEAGSSPVEGNIICDFFAFKLSESNSCQQILSDGKRVDVRDYRGQWSSACVVGMGVASSNGIEKHFARVHFDQFSHKWDEWISIDEWKMALTEGSGQGRIAPVFTKAPRKLRVMEVVVLHRQKKINSEVVELTNVPFILHSESFRSCEHAYRVIVEQAVKYLSAEEWNRLWGAVKAHGGDEANLFEAVMDAKYAKYLPFSVRLLNQGSIFNVQNSKIEDISDFDSHSPVVLCSCVLTRNIYCKNPDCNRRLFNNWEGMEFPRSKSRPFCNIYHSKLVISIDWMALPDTASPTFSSEGVFHQLNTAHSSNSIPAILSHWFPIVSFPKNRFASCTMVEILDASTDLSLYPHENCKEAQSEVQTSPGLLRSKAHISAFTRVALSQCLHSFTQPDELGADSWYCSSCETHRNGIVSSIISRLPDILIVQLKRFQVLNGHSSESKINTLVDFPLHSLDLKDFIDIPDDQSRNIYDLYAVSNHLGNMGGGHYTAFVRCGVANATGDDYITECYGASKWMHFDDESVESVANINDVVSEYAYVLFYKRRDLSASNLLMSKNNVNV